MEDHGRWRVSVSWIQDFSVRCQKSSGESGNVCTTMQLYLTARNSTLKMVEMASSYYTYLAIKKGTEGRQQ